MKPLTKRIKAWRKREGLTLVEAGARLRVAPSTIQRWENGVTPLPVYRPLIETELGGK